MAIVGLPAGDGARATTGPIGAERAATVPAALAAVTRSRRRWPTSPAASVYVAAVASSIGAQSSPWRPQRSHWRSKRSGAAPFHSPGVPVSTLPGRSPSAVTAGGVTGRGGAGPTTADGGDVAAPTPTPLSIVTTTRSVKRTSAVTGV